jgi:hypothetical protein
VRPSAVDVHVVEPERANLRDAQATAARKADDDQIALSIQRSLRLCSGVGEDRRQLATCQNAGHIDGPGGIREHGGLRGESAGSTELPRGRREGKLI